MRSGPERRPAVRGARHCSMARIAGRLGARVPVYPADEAQQVGDRSGATRVVQAPASMSILVLV
jgi:hypothetical protein